MEQFSNWVDIPNSSELIKNQDLDQYLEGINPDIDDLLNQTLLGIQDLDVPTGFPNDLPQHSSPKRIESNHHHSAGNSFHFHQARHSRKISGTAIFGFENHTRELSIELKNDDKSISPVQLVRMASTSAMSSPLRKSISAKPVNVLIEEEDPKPSSKKSSDDYLVPNNNPNSYKFPPSPDTSDNDRRSMNPGNMYSAKYLQELSRLNHSQPEQVYVDDIEPLLEEDDKAHMKYVPIPVQDPSPRKKQAFNANANTYLPPPSPPRLTNDSPDQSSPSPRPFTRESSPVNLNGNLNSSPAVSYFYNPQFFSDDNYFNDGYSSPINSQSLSSSPLKADYYSSPLRNVPVNTSENIDVNETITQLTPLKPSQTPMTPSRNKIMLEWSPIVSPSVKNNRDVRNAIKQSSPKRRIKKTSLLPPGELDRYFDGPDSNKTFTCTYKNCGKRFTRRYNVRSHIQTHLSDRPFPCMYCPKKFVRQHDLNRHVKGHLEARHCRCPCGKEFTRIDAMKKHRLRNICSGRIPPDQADSLRSPERQDDSPLDDYSSPARIVESNENEITNNLLQNLNDIPAL